MTIPEDPDGNSFPVLDWPTQRNDGFGVLLDITPEGTPPEFVAPWLDQTDGVTGAWSSR